jgi:putative membrane protein
MPICHKVFINLSSVNILLAVVLVVFYHTTSHTIMQKAEEKRLKGENPTDYIAMQGMSFVLKSFLVGVAGFFLEVDGVKTGLIFGEYNYGDVLGPKFMDVPLILGLNWFFMVYCSTQIAGLLKLPTLPTALLSGAIMTFYDLILEPNAVAMGYWHWHGGTIPLQNYIAWFVAGSVLSLFYIYRSTRVHNMMAVFLFTIQVIFFSLLIVIRQFS